MPALIRFLTERILMMSRELARGDRAGGAQQQYEQNNRRGAGGSNYTGD